MEITSDIIDNFRNNYPEFPITNWSDAILTRALCEGDVETGSKRWGAYFNDCHNFKQRGMFLFTAHWLVMNNGAQGDVGRESVVDFTARLNLSGKSVGDESVQYRITEIQSSGDDWLSISIYGTQFLRLRQRAGMGAMAL